MLPPPPLSTPPNCAITPFLRINTKKHHLECSSVTFVCLRPSAFHECDDVTLTSVTALWVVHEVTTSTSTSKYTLLYEELLRFVIRGIRINHSFCSSRAAMKCCLRSRLVSGTTERTKGIPTATMLSYPASFFDGLFTDHTVSIPSSTRLEIKSKRVSIQ